MVSVGPPNATRVLVRDLSVRFESRSLTAIVGPNGAGKSTLLHTLVGLRAPEGGTVTLGETPLGELSGSERAKRIAFLPQSTPAVPALRVRDVVLLGRLPYLPRLGPASATDLDACTRALDRVDATGLSDRRMGTLSGGERQRVMLARMLASEAKVLVLDEPTTSLDVRHRLALLEQLVSLAEDGRCVVLAIHDLTLADAYATHAICLDIEGGHTSGTRANVLQPGPLESVFGVGFERPAGQALRVAIPRAPSRSASESD